MRTLCGGLWPGKRPERAVAARAGTQPQGTLAPKIPRLQIGSAGTWAPGSECLKRRARLSPEPAVSGVPAQSQPDYFPHIATVSLRRGCSRFVKVGARTLQARFGRPPKPSGLRLAPLRGKKRRKQVTYPCLLGAQLEAWGAPRIQSCVLDTSSETSGCLQRGTRSAPPSNKPLATGVPPAPWGGLGSPSQLALAPHFSVAEPALFPPSS